MFSTKPFALAVAVGSFLALARSDAEASTETKSAAGINSFAGVSKADEKPKVIPLEDIWAWDMPGTRDVRELEPANYGEHDETLSEAQELKRFNKAKSQILLKALKQKYKNQPIEQGFAVAATGVEAIHKAIQHIKRGAAKKHAALPSNEPITLVFYSKEYGRYLHIKSVVRKGKTFTINYQLVPHTSKQLTQHFALIPTGLLTDGKYVVEMKLHSTPPRNQVRPHSPVPKNVPGDYVCRPFEFVVSS